MVPDSGHPQQQAPGWAGQDLGGGLQVRTLHRKERILDDDLPTLSPGQSLTSVTRYFAAYNLVCGPVVDEQGHLLGAVTVDDLLDHLLPPGWRHQEDEADLQRAAGPAQ